MHRLDDPVVAADFFARQLEDRAQEELLAIFVDAQFGLIGWQHAFIGTLTKDVFDARPILQAALLCNAAGFIVGHNHPSTGDPLPSADDLRATERLVKAGEAVGIQLLDHIIVGERGRWVALRRRGGW